MMVLMHIGNFHVALLSSPTHKIIRRYKIRAEHERVQKQNMSLRTGLLPIAIIGHGVMANMEFCAHFGHQLGNVYGETHRSILIYYTITRGHLYDVITWYVSYLGISRRVFCTWLCTLAILALYLCRSLSGQQLHHTSSASPTNEHQHRANTTATFSSVLSRCQHPYGNVTMGRLITRHGWWHIVHQKQRRWREETRQLSKGM